MTAEELPPDLPDRDDTARLPSDATPPVPSNLPRDVPDEEIAAVRDVSFPIAMRGYDRAAVDAYVTRVNRIIAELQVTKSPQAAVRHALDELSEETKGILERAHEAADEITARSRAKADDRIQEAEREARARIDEAAAQVRELEADADEISVERRQLIEDARRVGEELQAVADEASGRFAPETPQSAAETRPLEAVEPEDDLEDAPPPVPSSRVPRPEDEDA
jgi:DivIVA domain-containing protein